VPLKLSGRGAALRNNAPGYISAALPVSGPGNNIAVYCRDPDGFRIEFYCEMEQIDDDEDRRSASYRA